MAPSRWAMMGVVAAFLAACFSHDVSGTAPDPTRLQGTWEVVSVERDGQPDPVQVGAHLTFAGNEVAFQARAPEIFDGTG